MHFCIKSCIGLDVVGNGRETHMICDFLGNSNRGFHYSQE